MMQWRPDQTFYPSPKIAMEAPQEKLAYVAMSNPDRMTQPDAMGVVDVDPGSRTNGKIVGLVNRTPHPSQPNVSTRRGDKTHWPHGERPVARRLAMGALVPGPMFSPERTRASRVRKVWAKMQRTGWLLAIALSGLVASGASLQEAALTNDQIHEMVKAGLSETLILDQIRNSKADFDLSTSGLIRLSKEGVPDRIISAMRNPSMSRVDDLSSSKQTVKLPDGEGVRLILMEDISSSTANVGDRISFTVADDVEVNGVVVIAKGAAAFGSITAVAKKGMLGRGGKLTMSMDRVKTVDDQTVRIRATAGREGDDKTGKTVAVAVFAGPFALLVKGKDVEAAQGTEYSAFIDEDRDITVDSR
ncbi:MAG: hypothetical protein IPM24_16305 [Bryobacterales bacterium]|nr:hypothetical protein [Bryobacterales bacterium]